MRLARDYEHAEGRDLRGFLDVRRHAGPRRGARGRGARWSPTGLDAVRLMTIHRAKGLEFPVVCVADLGRARAPAGGRGCCSARDGDGRAAARRRSAAATPVPALAYDAARRRGGPRRRRGGAPPALRRDDPRPGAADPLRRRPTASAGPSRAPAARRWTGSSARSPASRARLRARRPSASSSAPGTAAPRACAAALNAPATSARCSPRPRSRPTRGRAAARPPPRCRRRRRWCPRRRRGRGRRRSGSPTRRCRRTPLRLPLLPPARARPAAREPPPPPPEQAAEERGPGRAHARLARARAARGAGLRPPRAAARRARRARCAARWGVEVTAEDVEDVARARRRVRRARRCASGSPPRGASAARRGFAFALEPGGGGPLVNGFVDVIAAEPDGARLVVDYKSRPPGRRRARRGRSSATTRPSGSSTRSPRCATARRASTSRTASSSAPASPWCAATPPPTPPALAEQRLALARGMLEERYPVTDAPAPRAVRRLPRPPRAVLAPGGADARAGSAGAEPGRLRRR